MPPSLEFGRDFDEARERVEQLQAEQGLRYVHSANEPLLIAGVATLALEIFDEQPDLDVVLVPIGGGSSACGCSIVRTGLASRAEVIGVQAEGSNAFARSWRSGTRVVGEEAATFAEGMATRVTFDLTFEILRRELDDVVTLTEPELAEGVRLAPRMTHNLAEGVYAVARRGNGSRPAGRAEGGDEREISTPRRCPGSRHAFKRTGRRVSPTRSSTAESS